MASQGVVSGSSVSAGGRTSGASKVLESARSVLCSQGPSKFGHFHPSCLKVIMCLLEKVVFS